LVWYRKWDQTLDGSNPPFYRWFVGGEINISDNCLDRHVREGRGGKKALIWCGSNGETRSLSYSDFLEEVMLFSASLRTLGIGRGDRVTIYMPMVPEAMVSMLSVARIGAVHSMVFSGFGVGALAERIRDSGSRLVLKADIENAVARHPAIAEVAAVSVPDLVRGEVLAVFVTPKKDVSFEPQRLAEEVRELVRKEVGPVAVIGSVYVVDRLPRTRTGKIMRRVLRAVLAGSQPGDLSTLEDEASVEEVRAAVESLMRSMEGRERV